MKKAQAAVEYIILLCTVMVIVLVGFNTFLPESQKQAEMSYNSTAARIMDTTAARIGNYEEKTDYFKARTYSSNYP